MEPALLQHENYSKIMAPTAPPEAPREQFWSHFGHILDPREPENLVKYVFLAPGSFENHVNYEVLARGSLENHVNAWVPLKPRKLRGCSAWEPLKPRKTRGHAPSELSTKLTQSLVKRSFETAARQMRKAM